MITSLNPKIGLWSRMNTESFTKSYLTIYWKVFFFKKKKKKKCTTGSLKNKIIDKIVLLNRRLYINRRSYLVCIQDDENVARVAYCTKQDAFLASCESKMT